MKPEIKAYHDSKTPDRAAICERLYLEINPNFEGAEHKIWHGAPVWFLDGNPIVGYHGLKAGMRLLFWSGQGFDEPGLENEGMFKAAGIMYKDVADINSDDIQRWLKKARTTQWDYKNLIKRRGELVPVV